MKRLVTICEGPTDRAILEALRGAGRLPADLEIKEPKDGISGAAPATATHLEAGVSAVVLCDLDEHPTFEAAASSFIEKVLDGSSLRTSPTQTSTPLGARTLRVELRGTNGTVSLVVASAGLPHDDSMREYRLQRFTMDDHLLRAVRKEDAYDAWYKPEKSSGVSHALVMKKLVELRDLYEENGIPITTAKSYLAHLRATVRAYVAAPTFAQQFTSRALRSGCLDDSFDALIDALNLAVAELAKG